MHEKAQMSKPKGNSCLHTLKIHHAHHAYKPSQFTNNDIKSKRYWVLCIYPRPFLLNLVAADTFKRSGSSLCGTARGDAPAAGALSFLKESMKVCAWVADCLFAASAVREYMSSSPTWPPDALRFCASRASSICSATLGRPTVALTAQTKTKGVSEWSEY